MKKRSTKNLDRSKVSIRLGACAAALGGTAYVVPEAHAGIVTFNTPIPIPPNTAGVYVNFTTGATATAAFTGWDFNPYLAGGGSQLGFYWGTATVGVANGVADTTTGPYSDLAIGTLVGPASTYTRVILGTSSSPYLTTGTHILGFSFTNDNTSTVDYGYLTMTTTAGSPGGYPATIQSWSFDDSGAPITVGAVPEPSTLLLTGAAMALGARGMRRWRRQKVAV
jgi:hypothetical protein